MSESIIPKAAVNRDAASLGVASRLGRWAVQARLNRVREGQVVLVDGGGRHCYGQIAADGLKAAIEVKDPRFYRLALMGGSLGFADAFIRGYWSTDSLTDLLRVFVRNIDLAHQTRGGPARVGQFLSRAAHGLRRNTPKGSRRNIEAHYDLGNDFFEQFLDPTMTYSCGYFQKPDSTMHEASLAKLNRLCLKLDLWPGDHLLEIGTGWGSMAIYAAREFGCRVTTTTISKQQYDLARKRVAEAGLADRVKVILTDYRRLEGAFDKLVSVEMIEAVGHTYLDTYFAQCSRLLKPRGVMALQAINMNDQHYSRYLRSVDFIQRFVFPGSCCPSVGAITESIGRSTDMRIQHVEDIGLHYAQTLRLWRRRFFENIDEVKLLGYSEAFIRLWEYYICYCEAGFQERYIGNTHWVLTKPKSRHTAEMGRAQGSRKVPS